MLQYRMLFTAYLYLLPVLVDISSVFSYVKVFSDSFTDITCFQ